MECLSCSCSETSFSPSNIPHRRKNRPLSPYDRYLPLDLWVEVLIQKKCICTKAQRNTMQKSISKSSINSKRLRFEGADLRDRGNMILLVDRLAPDTNTWNLWWYCRYKTQMSCGCSLHSSRQLRLRYKRSPLLHDIFFRPRIFLGSASPPRVEV